MGGGEEFRHTPVLVREVVEALSPALSPGSVFVDCTVGGGGHAEALLETAPGIRMVGMDRDPDALEAARNRLARFSPRLALVKANFAQVGVVTAELVDGEVKGVLYDLGVSSPQLDRPDRGFGYRLDAPLDMRMDRSDPLSAAEVVNTYPEERLAEVISKFGDERFARRIARAIVRRRVSRPFDSSADLAEVVRSAIPAATRRRGPHPARRTFQALRIEVNRELESLADSLPQSIEILSPGGRLAVIAYHSGEDRLVKRAMADAARGCKCPADFPRCVCGARASLRLLNRKPIRPTTEEVEANPRSDSARLRVAEKLEVT